MSWRWFCWLLLATFAGCLNPQPDGHPLNRPSQSGGAGATEGGADLAPPSSAPPLAVANDDGHEASPATPAPPTQTTAPTSAGDAGAPAPLDAGGNQGDPVEGDAGPAD